MTYPYYELSELLHVVRDLETAVIRELELNGTSLSVGDEVRQIGLLVKRIRNWRPDE